MRVLAGVVAVFIGVLPCLHAQFLSGCPMLGCFPSGRFALNVSVPSNQDGVEVVWTAELTNTSLPPESSLGCVTNENNIVCPTPSGFVSVVSDTGKVEWRTAPLLHDPPLPLLDVYGDFIACDGRYLCKVDNNGAFVKPNIKFQKSSTVFSLNIAENNLFLITCEDGEIICYNTAGIPFASIFLQGSVERLNGTFIPVSPLVFSGDRAYILTEFKVDEGVEIPPGKEHVMGMQRMYAMDVVDRMIKILDIQWYINFERMEGPQERSNRSARCLEKNLRAASARMFPGPQSVVMTMGDKVVVSLAPPMADCNRDTRLGQPPIGESFWGLHDIGTNGDVLFRKALAPSNLAAFEAYSNPQPATSAFQKWTGPDQSPTGRRGVRKMADAPEVFWANPQLSENITCYELETGNVVLQTQLQKLLSHPGHVTSKLMVSSSPCGDAYCDRLVMGVRLTGALSTSSPLRAKVGRNPSAAENATSYLVALETDAARSTLSVLWMTPAPEDAEIVGQVSAAFTKSGSVVLVAMATTETKSFVFGLSETKGSSLYWKPTRQ